MSQEVGNHRDHRIELLGLEGCGVQLSVSESKEERPAQLPRGLGLWTCGPEAVGSTVAEAPGGRNFMAAWRDTEIETEGERWELASGVLIALSGWDMLLGPTFLLPCTDPTC
jgi:hypothetical protein